MSRSYWLLAVLCVAGVGCDRTNRMQAEVPPPAPPPDAVSAPAIGLLATPPAAGEHLFLDVHELGPGKVTLEAAAGAHQKDLATQAKYGANFKSYWVDEKAGKIYCLVEAPSADAALSTHREAHGLMPTSIEEVSVGR